VTGAAPAEPNAPRRWPAADFSRVPYAVYVDPEIYREEQARIFRGPVWCYLGLEAELPEPGSFLTSHVGDTPVIVARNRAGEVHAFVNRCAHRGATVCRLPRGQAMQFLCVYHQWSYTLDGDLLGVPYRKGIRGAGGMPSAFDTAAHGLEKLRVASRNGVLFGSFSEAAPPLEDFLDAPMCAYLDRVFRKPVEILGYTRQVVPANWKLYCENTKDPYHASLLHLFHATFGFYRSTQQGGVTLDRSGMHSAIFAKQGTDDQQALSEAFSDTRFSQVETREGAFKLRDPSILAGRREFDDGISTLIVQLFPSVVIQQISNTLATRRIIPRAPGSFELLWTYFGYADDDAELRAMRLKQANLIGPAGFISMEDGEATRLVQQNAANARERHSVIEMGGLGEIATQDHLVHETSVRGMWRAYCALMGIEPGRP
jgi:anthranilate 1,2-dioxygenase large subunit